MTILTNDITFIDPLDKKEKIILKTVYDKEEILEIIENLLVNGIEMMISYWACMPTKEKSLPADEHLRYIKQVVTIAEREASTDQGIKSVKLTEDKLLEGLAVMNQKYPKHFSDAIKGNDDGDTADVFIQCCVLKEVVYG